MAKYPYRKKRVKRKYNKKRYSKKPSKRTGYLAARQTELKSIVLPANTLEYIHQEAFRAIDTPQFSSFERIFDQYRIKKVTMKLFPTTFTDATINNRLLFASSIDLDGGFIADFNALVQCSNARLSPWAPDVKTGTKSITLAPRFRNVIVKDASDPALVVYTQSLGRKNAWIDMADGGQTQHFGLNLGWKAANAAGTLNEDEQLQICTTYHLEFRKIR